MQSIFRAIVAIAVVACLAGLPAASRGADTTPFEIDAALPLTGFASFVGSTVAKIFAVVEADVNAHGGIRGRPIKFVIADDQATPQIAVQILSQQLTKKPSLVLGGALASTCLAGAPLVKDNGPLLMCFSPSVTLAPGWVYSISFTAGDIYASVIRYYRLKGYTKIGLLLTTDATGQAGDAIIPTIIARPENRGLTIVDDQHYNNNDISVTAQLEHLRASGAQAIVNNAVGSAFATVLRGLRDTGTTIPIWASQANLSYTQLEGYKSIWPTETPVIIGGFPPIVPDAVPDRAVRAAIDRYTATLKAAGIARPDGLDSFAWDTLQIVVDAYRHLGTDATPAQLRDYINGITNWPGIYGRIDFKANPQRGVSGEWLDHLRWDPVADRFYAISKPGGAPL